MATRKEIKTVQQTIVLDYLAFGTKVWLSRNGTTISQAIIKGLEWHDGPLGPHFYYKVAYVVNKKLFGGGIVGKDRVFVTKELAEADTRAGLTRLAESVNATLTGSGEG